MIEFILLSRFALQERLDDSGGAHRDTHTLFSFSVEHSDFGGHSQEPWLTTQENSVSSSFNGLKYTQRYNGN